MHLFLKVSCVVVPVLVLVIVHQNIRSSSTMFHVTENNDGFKEELKKVMEATQRNRIMINKMHCAAKQVLPSGGFCIDKNKLLVGGNYLWSAKLCAGLEDIFSWSTVGDLGAGLGHYGQCFLRLAKPLVISANMSEIKLMNQTFYKKMSESRLLGTPQVIKSWQGWDGASNIDELSAGNIGVVDLMIPVDLGRKFDWIMSLEVGEHIPKAGEKNFIDNLVKHACVGVVLSWAVPGQGGHSHVNCRTNDYVKDQMAKRGLESDQETEYKLRGPVELDYFKNTLMVFRFVKRKC
ncbi:uncharacterized protein LOC121853239 isoform X2 [Homarus americanus]|uniref:uncharacterized protein LOC121853239 isoform X2 n=1 Tax=Homarus americanus TaxID=6706 RepID=UPI001C441B47|nr:uncharacterized protein LOC121853239 isoform X2 [Homarus americanus]XP_042203183.1 uncharacterized protein LOC121853239 isoform X2 [Homarus americanus]XP_042203184.1 uncharacterized protein LOC121853239 isoform X2 [Homarus americanus]